MTWVLTYYGSTQYMIIAPELVPIGKLGGGGGGCSLWISNSIPRMSPTLSEKRDVRLTKAAAAVC